MMCFVKIIYHHAWKCSSSVLFQANRFKADLIWYYVELDHEKNKTHSLKRHHFVVIIFILKQFFLELLIWYKCFIRDRDELEGDTPGSTPEKAGTKNKKRCAVCKCKLELAQRTIGRCRCGKHYQVCSSVLQPCTSICSCIITCLFNKQTSFFVQFSISNVYNRIKLNGICWFFIFNKIGRIYPD